MSKQSDLVSVSQGTSGNLTIASTGDASLDIFADSDNNGTNQWPILNFRINALTGTPAARIYQRENVDSLVFDNNGAERMRIDSSGNVLVGKTSPTISSTGVELRPNGQLFATQSANYPLLLNRTTSGGDIAVFRYNGATVGSIGTDTNDLYVASANTHSAGLWFNGASALGNQDIRPCNSSGAGLDNVIDLGDSAYRFDDIYATNGTIQTSDRNEKQDIETLSEAEQRVAVAAKGLLRKYRWKDAVAEKGDAARIHFGIIAQDLQAAFETEGLDAGRYGMFISSTWWEAEVEKTREVEQEDGTTITETYTVTETYDQATEGATERTRLGVRYPELLAFIIAAL